MATLETQKVDAIIDSSRRRMIALGGTALAGLALVGIQKANAAALTDGDILNFALNLEYLEANFYSLAVYGLTIDKLPTPIAIKGGNGGTPGTVTTKVAAGATFPPVPFTNPAVQSIAAELAIDEGDHVAVLQNVLGSYGVSMPDLDLYNSFNALAVAAGLGSSFDPFASDANFLIGGYIFEDVGTSAYHGAAGSLSKTALPTAVQIHAVEAYHAGTIRTTLAYLDALNGNTNYSAMTQKISALRATLTATQPSTAPAVTPGDIGLLTTPQTMVALETGSATFTASTIVNADPKTSFAWARTPQQVLAVVTSANANGASTTAANTGLFFPSGLNGVIN